MSLELLRRLSAVAKNLPKALYRTWTERYATLPPSGAETELGRRLWMTPRPLIHPTARVIVIFSHKSACTSALVWFLHHLGHTKAAMDYHAWPHQYREEVYYHSQLYRRAYDLDLADFTLIRIVRDPWDRAVSSFRHALEWGYADTTIAKLLRRRDVASRGLAFAEFLELLERLDLTTCDEHFRIQRHPVENILPVHYLINVSTENLFTRLNDVEVELGLPRSDMAKMAWVRRLRAHSRPLGEFVDATDAYTRRLSRQDAKCGPWPPYEALLTPEARERIARMYRIDIESYVNPRPELGR